MNYRTYFIAIGLVLVASCASHRSMFEKTRKENTIEAYKNYLQKYPDSEFADEAVIKLEALEFKMVEQENTITAYNTFQKKYPDTKYRNIIQTKVEQIIVQKAIISNSSDSLVYLLQKYPNLRDRKNLEFISELRKAKDESNTESSNTELAKIKENILNTNLLEILSHLVHGLTDNSLDIKNQEDIQNILLCCIYGKEMNHNEEINDKLRNLSDFYLSDGTNSLQYSLELVLINELKVKWAKTTLDSTISITDRIEEDEMRKQQNELRELGDKYDGKQSINNYLVEASELRKSQEREMNKITRSSLLKIAKVSALFSSYSNSVFENLPNYVLSNEAKMYFCELLIKMIKNGEYVYENHGLENNEKFIIFMKEFFASENNLQIRNKINEVIDFLEI